MVVGAVGSGGVGLRRDDLVSGEGRPLESVLSILPAKHSVAALLDTELFDSLRGHTTMSSQGVQTAFWLVVRHRPAVVPALHQQVHTVCGILGAF